MKIIVSLLITICFLPAWSGECKSEFNIPVNEMGHYIEGRLPSSLPLIREGHPTFAHYYTRSKDGELEYVGKFESYPRGEQLSQFEFFVEENFRRRGLSSFFLSEALAFQKNVKSIEGQFYLPESASVESVNYKVFMHKKSQGLSNEEAFRESPVYKSAAKFGFTKISSLIVEPSLVLFEIERN